MDFGCPAVKQMWSSHKNRIKLGFDESDFVLKIGMAGKCLELGKNAPESLCALNL